MAKLPGVTMPKSSAKVAVLKVLKEQGYIEDFDYNPDLPKSNIKVKLKYFHGKAVIEKITRVSKPSLRVYKSAKDMPDYYNGLGINVVSTSKGLMTSIEAKKQNLGGELICSVV